MSHDPRQLFERWAPPASPWSEWAKPVLFALTKRLPDPPAAGPQPPPDLRALSATTTPFAVVLDLPGTDAIAWAAALAERGFATVPLFNGAPGHKAMVNCDSLVYALATMAPPASPLAADAPPCFMLDANRMSGGRRPSPGQFDNRWLVFPQDFPSASMLLSRSIPRVVLVQRGPGRVAEDLSHVLYAWARAGVEVLRLDPDGAAPAEPLHVARPRGFRSSFRRFLVMCRLHRNSAGGFGGVVPDVSQTSIGYA